MIRGIGAVDPGRRRRRPSIVCSNADCGVISGGPVASGGCGARVSARRYAMKCSPFAVALTFIIVLRNFQVLWQSDGYESHFRWRDMHFGHSLAVYGE